jgi:elongation factor 1-gamma
MLLLNMLEKRLVGIKVILPVFEKWNVGQHFPALRTEQGGVWDMNNILRHLARVSVCYPLYGENTYEQSVIDTWLEWARMDVEVHANALFPVGKLPELDPAFVHSVFDKIKASFDALNKHLLNWTFLATRKLSIADIGVALAILPLLAEFFDPGMRKAYPNLTRWFETVVNQPSFLKIVGAVTYCAKSPLPPVPKKGQQQKKKAPKEKKEGTDEGGDDGGDDDGGEEVGEKLDLSYLEKLPKTEFSLENWKRKYANTDPCRPEALDYFWQNYDNEGFCMYSFTYKYPEECTVDFKTSNLFGGYLQRLDCVKHLARFSIVSTVILKKEKLFYIYGVWLFRGKDMPVEFTKVDDYNNYTWTKIDIKNKEQKDFCDDVWSWSTLNNWGGRGEFVVGRSWGC